MSKRGTHSPEFKARVAMEVISGRKTIQEIFADKEWVYGMPFQNSEERNEWLHRYLSIYNRRRKHTALGGRSPQQRLDELLC